MNWKPATGQKIERIYAWVATEPDGGEGIVSTLLGDTHYPLIGADKARIESFREFAQLAGKVSGYPVHLICFEQKRILE
jgi:hypothetical protein